MTHPDDDHARRLTDWDFRVEQELEQFRLYEHRRAEFELQATAITAGALTMSALLIAAEERLARLGDLVEYGISVTILALVCSIICASIARFASWRTPEWLGRPSPPRHVAVRVTLQALRNADDVSDLQLRSVALDHWTARSMSAWELGQFKYTWLKRATLALLIPLLLLVVVGVALLR
jgi:hypothetical protein